MAWVQLIAAGALEIFWATCMKLSHGFSEPKFSILTFLGIPASFFFLSQASKTLPLGTAYAIWTGIGALGAEGTGIALFKEPLSALRIFFAVLLLAGIAGLKATSAQ